MEVEILKEVGYEEALRGMSYSYLDEAEDRETWWKGQQDKAVKRAAILASKTPEHAKFLRFIELWVDIRATRAFWVEADTYKIGFDQLSASTMHKLGKRRPEVDDFSGDTPLLIIDAFKLIWDQYKEGYISLVELKDALPEGYLQTRMVKLNYATLRNICSQRKGHRYAPWATFIDEMFHQVEHPEFIEDCCFG